MPKQVAEYKLLRKYRCDRVQNPEEVHLHYFISIVKCGYFECVTGVCFADTDYVVDLVEIDPHKVGFISEGYAPIYESDLKASIQGKWRQTYATASLQVAIRDTDITFTPVSTLSSPDGSINLMYVFHILEETDDVIRGKEGFQIVIMKITVFPETTGSHDCHILGDASSKKAGIKLRLSSSPRHLQEGTATHEFLSSERVVIRAGDPKTTNVLTDLYTSVDFQRLATSNRMAEMVIDK